ncbi:MAG: hypothetical protein FJZ00_05700 [Candidatus Sericytochromatia bacterium]|uniref:Uncharacterized protein n=1 Tax=Candidatus Tanganyikabacteria bacterium TaxID=2961651 RepID=A0A938BMT7_9BACT|nr:hypothetical protein [Candidatus Tanganyikabacteria bacterium]
MCDAAQSLVLAFLAALTLSASQSASVVAVFDRVRRILSDRDLTKVHTAEYRARLQDEQEAVYR